MIKKQTSKTTSAETFKTKSGTTIYVVGNPNSEGKVLKKIGRPFIKYYNKDFTKQEQRQIGNIFYDVYANKHTHSQMSLEERNNKLGGQASYFKGPDARNFNLGKNMMIEVSFGKQERNNESYITHELIHAKEYTTGRPGSQEKNHNEKKIDFETVGRVTKKGIDTFDGAYYHRTPTKIEVKKIIAKFGRTNAAVKEWERFLHQNIIDDRILLTKSVKKQMIGKPIEKKVKKTFKKSTIFRKNLYN